MVATDTRGHDRPLPRPVVVFSNPSFARPLDGYLTRPRDRVPPTTSRLAPPAVVNPFVQPFVASPIRVALAPSSRGRPQYRIGQPLVVFVLPIQYGPGVRLAPQSTQGRRTRSRLAPPAVVTPAVVQTFAGPKVKRAPSTRLPRRPSAVLAPPLYIPTPVVQPQIAGGPGVRLTTIRPAAVHSKLRPPAVVNPSVAARPIKISLVRIRPFPTDASVFEPAVIEQAQGPQGGVGIQLAPSFRGRPKSKLSAPAVVTPFVAAVYSGPQTTLARIRPSRTIARLLSVPAAFRPIGFAISVTLAPSKRGTPKSHLLPPSVVRTAVELSGPEVTLVRIRPPRTSAVLRRPVVVRGSIAFGGPRIRLTSPLDRVPATISRLRPAVVTVATETFTGPSTVALARIRPPRTLARIEPPTVIDLTPQTYFIAVALAPSFRGKPTSFLGAPTDLSDAQDIGLLKTHLAYSRRGIPKSRLEPPTVVAPVLARAIEKSLAYSLRGKAKPELRPPIVVQAFRIPVVSVTLAPSSRGIPKSQLGRPTDLVDAADLGLVKVTLAPSRYPHPKSRLSPPTVVFPFFARATDITLARIRPVATRWLLRKPVDLVDREDVGAVRVHLAYSRRGAPKSILRKPTVIDLRPQTYFVSTTLVRITPPPTLSKLGAPRATLIPGYPVDLQAEIQLVRITPPPTMSILRKPVVVAPVLARAIATNLAYSRRGKPRSILRPPRVIDLRPQTRFLSVTLAPSRRPVAKSKLTRVIVQRFVAPRPVEVTLTRIRPARTSAFYTGVVYGGRVHAPISVTLAPSSRLARTPHSRLLAPTVVREFIARPTEVTLAPQARRPGEAVLSPPAAIGAPERFFGPAVTLAPSSRGRTIAIRISPDAAAAPPCYGVATGSTAPSAENALETEAGATTTSTITAGAETASSTAAASTIEGTTAPGAENDISDAQREGC